MLIADASPGPRPGRSSTAPLVARGASGDQRKALKGSSQLPRRPTMDPPSLIDHGWLSSPLPDRPRLTIVTGEGPPAFLASSGTAAGAVDSDGPQARAPAQRSSSTRRMEFLSDFVAGRGSMGSPDIPCHAIVRDRRRRRSTRRSWLRILVGCESGPYTRADASPRTPATINRRNVLQFKGLGPPAVERDGAPVAGRTTQRRRLALLALLATARERGVSRDRLMAY